MHITFVRPNLQDDRSSDAMQPLAFALLKRMTPPDVEVVFHDERLAPIPLDAPTDLVAMTVETYTARRAHQLATQFRRRGIPVVMGGYHATFLPDECGHYADSVVLGDVEGLWPHVVEDARRGRLKPRYEQDGYPALGGRPLPDRSIFAGKRYAPVTLVQYGRGCRFNCDFCSIHAFYGSSQRQRPVDEVVREIEEAGRPPTSTPPTWWRGDGAVRRGRSGRRRRAARVRRPGSWGPASMGGSAPRRAPRARRGSDERITSGVCCTTARTTT